MLASSLFTYALFITPVALVIGGGLGWLARRRDLQEKALVSLRSRIEFAGTLDELVNLLLSEATSSYDEEVTRPLFTLARQRATSLARTIEIHSKQPPLQPGDYAVRGNDRPIVEIVSLAWRYGAEARTGTELPVLTLAAPGAEVPLTIYVQQRAKAGSGELCWSAPLQIVRRH